MLETLGEVTKDFKDKALALAKAKVGPKLKKAPCKILRVPVGDLEQKDAKLLLPPGAFIWRGYKRLEWNGDLKPFAIVSGKDRDFATPKEACMYVIKKLWDCHYVLHPELDQASCPVEGLFPTEVVG